MVVTAANIRRVAKRVRYWAEREARKAGFLDNLECFCAIGARQLFQELKTEGFPKLKLALHDDDGEDHCFVLCDDYLVDITASQFDQPKVVVRHKDNLVSRYGINYQKIPYYWDHNHTFNTVDAFNAYLDEKWPEEQITLAGAREFAA